MTKRTTDPIGAAVIGAGYWGRNYVRNLAALPGVCLRWVCDLDQSARDRAARIAPQARVTTDLAPVLDDEEVAAVIVATNSTYHHAHTMAALAAGKHVLVEKPMATTVAHATEMTRLARKNKRTLMVGHLLLYHPAVEHLRRIVRSGELGEIYYLYAARVNLGRIRNDENALWSFGPHDLSIIDYLLGRSPQSVSARGRSYLQPDVEDVVFLNLSFPNRVMAQIQLSWLDPRKERRLTVVGSRKMVVFDDTQVSEKLRIYDKGFERPPEYETYGDYLSIRFGDIHIPHLSMVEPLRAECQHFLDCVRTGQQPRSSAEDGLRVVRILAAAEGSMAQGGSPVAVQD